MTDKICPLMVTQKRTKQSSGGQTIENYRYSICIEDRCALWKEKDLLSYDRGERDFELEAECGLLRRFQND